MNAPVASTPGTFDCRQIFAQTLVELARQDARIVAVCNDSVGSSNLGAFQKEFGERLVNVGIAEQNMIGVAAGLSNGGFIPFVCCASPFLTGRALEQVKADIAYNGYHVVLCAMSPGMSYGELGPTHHSIEDISWMRALTDLPVIVPADPAQTEGAIRWAVEFGKPSFLRIGRFKIPSVSEGQAAPFSFGKANRLREGTDLTIVATGVMVSRALDAAADLAADGISARVVNIATIKPLDEAEIIAAARDTGGIVTIEEGVISGGLGAAVAEVVVREHPVKMRLLGVPGFAPTGATGFLLDHFGLNAAGIVAAARELRA